MEPIMYHPIGDIHSPFDSTEGMPIQPAASEAEGWIEINPAYQPGLQDLAGFSHIILLYHFHQAGEANLIVEPFLDEKLRGVFATRAPVRPNPIGVSVVELISVEKSRLNVGNIDILDGTPLLDIKPYIPAMEAVEDVRFGWLSGSIEAIRRTQADDRFAADS